MNDLNVTFDKLDKVCKQENEEWKKMMEENNTFDTISKTAKDIADRKDREKALEFAKCIGNLFRENGVTAMIEEYRTGGTLKDKNLIEEYYGVAITGLDFTEHDKMFEDKIEELEKRVKELDRIDAIRIDEKRELKQRIAELENKETVELPFDALETANMLINATYKSKNCMTGTMYDKDVYDIDGLEQIAEHLLVYCKHNREDDE